MVQMVTQAAKEGYAIFWITGSPALPGGGHAGQPDDCGRHGWDQRRLSDTDRS